MTSLPRPPPLAKKPNIVFKIQCLASRPLDKRNCQKKKCTYNRRIVQRKTSTHNRRIAIGKSAPTTGELFEEKRAQTTEELS